MSEMLKSIKADLLSRPVLPLLVLLCAALAAAVGYGVLGGSAKSAPSLGPPPISVPPVPGPAVSSAPANPNAALAETTSGSSFQHGGKVHNPFAPLPGSNQITGTQTSTSVSSNVSSTAGTQTVTATQGGGTTTSTTVTTSGPQGSGAPSESGSPTTGTSPASTPPVASPKTTVTVYRVSASLQQVSANGRAIGKPRSFKDIQTLTPLPGRHDPLITPYLAGKEAKSMIFLLLRAPILHGHATCLPSAEDCLAIEVPLHHGEELRYLSSNGKVISYRLTVTAIHPVTVSLTAQQEQEAQRKGLSIIKQRAARLHEALAKSSTAAKHR